jgi:hypothetical protein
LQLVQRRQPARADRQGRAGAVVGQAVPGGELDHVELGREVGGGIGHRAHRRVVGRDEDRAPFGGTGEVGHDERLRPARHGGKGQRRLRGKDAGEIGHEREKRP